MNTLKRCFFAGVGAFSIMQSTFAQINPGTNRVSNDIKGKVGDDPIVQIQTFIKYIMGYLALIMVAMALWGGWKILTSGDADEGKESGKKIIINAVIGIVVIFFAWTITRLVFEIISEGRVQV